MMADALIIIEEAAEAAADEVRRKFEVMRPLCESPIEEIFLAALVAEAGSYSVIDPVHFYAGQFSFGQPHSAPFDSIDIHMQAMVGSYRVDFLIDEKFGSDCRVIIVECDGHDFHERTKEQARRDKQRDRYFASLGLKVLHFTGSEIFADPAKCVEEVFNHLCNGRFGRVWSHDHGSRK